MAACAGALEFASPLGPDFTATYCKQKYNRSDEALLLNVQMAVDVYMSTYDVVGTAEDICIADNANRTRFLNYRRLGDESDDLLSAIVEGGCYAVGPGEGLKAIQTARAATQGRRVVARLDFRSRWRCGRYGAGHGHNRFTKCL
jgi:hypothetical protein